MNNTNKPVLPSGVYGITAEEFARGRSNEQVVRAMIAGGIRIIQYRAKGPGVSQRRILEECYRIRDLTGEAGVLFIINDHADIAILTDADGVHVGQDDLPVAEVRSLIGEDKLIGLSTHSPDQAKRALDQGADYIGVGPVYATRTKSDACDPVGLSFVSYVAQHIALPFTAIGGIKCHNIQEVAAHGAKSICLVSEIAGATDIVATVRQLNEQIERIINTNA